MKIQRCYPNYARKAVSFTIDDGILVHDEKFLSIVKPRGILGTFNLCSVNIADAEKYRKIYFGYEIANHCKYHPYAFNDSLEYEVSSDEEPGGEVTSPIMLYRCKGISGLYNFVTERGVRQIADTESYIRFEMESRCELEAVFGEGTVQSFVWPYCEQNNKELFHHLSGRGYYGIRKTGDLLDKTGFSLPEDWNRWTYNASNRNLLEVMEKYESYPDDGELKCFIFGVHSYDFERDGNWQDLEEFAEKYGCRDDFYYETVGNIYRYSEAMKSLEITEDKIINNSGRSLFLLIDGKKTCIGAGESLQV